MQAKVLFLEVTSVDRLTALTSPQVVAEIDITDLVCSHDLKQSYIQTFILYKFICNIDDIIFI